MKPEVSEWIDGWLLGDGCLEKMVTGVKARHNSSKKAYTEYVRAFFEETLDLEKSCGVREYGFRQPTGVMSTCYQWRGRTNQVLLGHWRRWYQPNKIIPDDFQITPVSLLQWFIGDGTTKQRLCIGRSESDVNRLVVLMNAALGLDLHPVRNSRTIWHINPTRKQARTLLDYMGPCPIPDYSYKWII